MFGKKYDFITESYDYAILNLLTLLECIFMI